jgi:RNA polymerase sigma factor (TIGR02999 family)
MNQEITELLRCHKGNESPQSADALYSALYPELRRIARNRLRGTGGQVGIETTSLVHESFLRLVDTKSLKPESRNHFLAYASKVMRSVIVDLVREAQTERRGGGMNELTLNTIIVESIAASAPDEEEALFVHDALRRLYEIDERMGQVVEMRYFGGLSDGEISEVLGVTLRTVGRDWEKARLFLHTLLKS